MEKHRLYEILFSLNPMQERLQESAYRSELMAFLDTLLTVTEHHHRYLLLNSGHIAEYIYFVEKGLARGFYYDEKKQREITRIIWDELQIIADPVSMFQRRKSDASIEVLPGSTLVSLSYDNLREVYRRFQVAESFTRCITLLYASYNGQRARDMESLSAWERYIKLLKTHPNIELKISKEIIASYLNITPQSLSRMLKKRGHP